MHNGSEISYNLSGDVKHQGLPVVGVSVFLFEYWRLSTGLIRQLIGQQDSGKRGEFNFVVGAGTYCLEVVPHPTTSFVRHLVDDIKVVDNTACHISLATGVIVSGSIVNAGGAKVTHGCVVALGIEPCSYRVEQHLDSKGFFSIVLPKGRYYLVPRFNAHDQDDCILNSHTTEIPFIATKLDIIELRQDRVCHLGLPEMVSFQGRIESSSGEGVPDAIVTLTPTESEDSLVLCDLCLRVSTRTSSSGSFGINVQPGLYDLHIQPPLLAPLAEMTVKSMSIETQTNCNFKLLPGVSLSGKVLFSQQPVGGCLVKASGKDTGVAVTNRHGEFLLKLSSGAYELTVVGQSDIAGRSANFSIAPSVRKVTLDDDTELTIELESGQAIVGKVVDTAGRPRPRARVSAISDEGRIPLPGDVALASGITGDDGRYCLALAAGCYWVCVNDEVGNSKHVELSTKPVVLDLTWSTGCVVSLTVLSEGGDPISRCNVRYGPYVQGQMFGATSGVVRTNENGVCQITVPSGVYSFYFQPPVDGSYESRSIRQLSVAGDLERKVRLNGSQAVKQPQP